MNPVDIAVIVAVSVAVVAVAGYLVYRRLKGKSVGCDCGSCSSCSACPHCKSKEEKNN